MKYDVNELLAEHSVRLEMWLNQTLLDIDENCPPLMCDFRVDRARMLGFLEAIELMCDDFEYQKAKQDYENMCDTIEKNNSAYRTERNNVMKNIEIYKKQYMQMQTDLINAFKKGISTLTMLNTGGELITVNNTFVHTMKSVDVTQSRLIHYQGFLKDTLTTKEHRTLQNDKAVSNLMTELNAVKASFDAVSKVIMEITEKAGDL